MDILKNKNDFYWELYESIKLLLRYLQGLIDDVIMDGFLLENKVFFGWVKLSIRKGYGNVFSKSLIKCVSSMNFSEVFTHKDCDVD